MPNRKICYKKTNGQQSLLWAFMGPLELDAWLGYTNPLVIRYFAHHHPEISENDAKQLFSDLMGWLWLNIHRNQEGKKTYLFGPLLTLDDMWHAFILHTREYIQFSETFYGQYLHHDIEPVGEEYELAEDELEDFLQDCFTYLGEPWVSRRFSDALA